MFGTECRFPEPGPGISIDQHEATPPTFPLPRIAGSS